MEIIEYWLKEYDYFNLTINYRYWDSNPQRVNLLFFK